MKFLFQSRQALVPFFPFGFCICTDAVIHRSDWSWIHSLLHIPLLIRIQQTINGRRFRPFHCPCHACTLLNNLQVAIRFTLWQLPPHKKKMGSRAGNQGIHIESTWARSKAAQVATRTDRRYRDYMGRMSPSLFCLSLNEICGCISLPKVQ
jgi:hypothetical protein